MAPSTKLKKKKPQTGRRRPPRLLVQRETVIIFKLSSMEVLRKECWSYVEGSFPSQLCFLLSRFFYLDSTSFLSSNMPPPYQAPSSSNELCGGGREASTHYYPPSYCFWLASLNYYVYCWIPSPCPLPVMPLLCFSAPFYVLPDPIRPLAPEGQEVAFCLLRFVSLPLVTVPGK